MKQKEDTFTNDIEDVILWSNQDWCYRYELYEMNHKSDDYVVIRVGSPHYEEFFERLIEKDGSIR